MTGGLRGPMPALFVTGLVAEARIAAGSGVLAVAGGGDATGLAVAMEAALRRDACVVVSFGIAGGLEPGLRPGTVLVARGVHDGAERRPVDAAWSEQIATLLPGARRADLVGVDRPAACAGDKAALHRRTGAAAVDMESHIAARIADLHGVPFAALRVVADPAERSLPPAALVGMRPDGTTDVGAVLRCLAGRPGQFPALVRTGLDARAAFAALRANRRALAPILSERADAPAATGTLADLGEAVGGATESRAA